METPQDGPHSTPQPYNPPPAFGQQPQYHAPTYPEQSGSTMVLVMGILGLVFCQVLAPIAWVMGNKELAAIDAGRRDPTNREHANIGKILGIIGTVLVALGILFFILWIAFVVLIAAGGAASAMAI